MSDNQTILNYGDDIQIVIVGDINAGDVVVIENELDHQTQYQAIDINQQAACSFEESEPTQCRDINGDEECRDISDSKEYRNSSDGNLLTDVDECRQLKSNLECENVKLFKALCETDFSGNCVPEFKTNNTVSKSIRDEVFIMEADEFENEAESDDKHCHKVNNDNYNDLKSQFSHCISIQGTSENIASAFEKIETLNMSKLLENTNIKKKWKWPNIEQNRPNSKFYLCSTCGKRFFSRSGKFKHAQNVHGTKIKAENSNGKFICNRHGCNECFDDADSLIEHRKSVHNLQPGRNSFAHIKCLECDVLYFSSKNELRSHLQDKHNLDMTPITLRFSKIEAFLAWKSKIERETLTIFHRKIITGNDGSMKFECFRTGKSYFKKHRTPLERMKRRKSNKLGVACSAGMYVEKNREGVFVTYYPTHYGHGKEMRIAELSAEEQAAVDELTSKGMSFEKLINDLKGASYMDFNHIYPIKKRYLNWVKKAFECEEYDSGLSDAECISQWIQKCCQLEEVPILLCEQENIGCENEKFILVIMTEFQKKIFMSSTKEIICVDTHNRTSDPHLIVVSVMDEVNTAFPVAYCVTNKLSKEVMTEFFTCVKESIGNLSPKYLVSTYHSYIYESWIAVMGYNPVWLWNRSFLEVVIKAHLRLHLKGNTSLKFELYNIIQTILDCRSEDVFVCIFKNFINRLENDKKTEKFGKWIMKWLGVNTEKWARCYQREIDCASNLHLELFRHMFRTCCKTGKNKKLYTLIIVIMKILRHKILDRFFNSLDNSKLDLAMNAINLCHDKGMTIPPKNICSLSDKLWAIESNDSEKVFVTQEVKKCPDHCCLKCYECNVCVHQFSCSCVHSIINANLCMHVHAVVFKFLGPLKDPASPENVECNSDAVLDDEDIFLEKESIAIQQEVSIPTPQTFTSFTELNGSTSTLLNDLPCKMNSFNNIPLNNSPPKINHLSNTSLNNAACMTDFVTTCAPTPLTFNSPSHINVAKNSCSTKTVLSFPASQRVTNLIKPTISNTSSRHLISDTPKQFSSVPILNTKTSSINPVAPNCSVSENLNSLDTALSQTVEIYQSLLSGKLKGESCMKVLELLNTCHKIVTNVQWNSSSSPIALTNSESEITGQNMAHRKVSCIKQSSKRTSSNLLDNINGSKFRKIDNSTCMTDSPHVLFVSNGTTITEENDLKDS